MENGQAYVEPDRCINCGTCIRECPQGAKTYRNDLELARQLVASGDPVAASIAPSFSAVFTSWQQKRIPSVLRMMGFTYVAETAIGAYYTAKATEQYVKDHPEKSHICTACPAVVSYIEKYRHDCVDALTPIVSPMIAHGRRIKKKLGKKTKVIFIGPCVAKKDEAQWPQVAGAIDCVLTFAELRAWMELENVSLEGCEESPFDEVPAGAARYFPLTGGCLRTADMATDVLDENTVCISGYEELDQSLQRIESGGQNLVIEPLFCPQGCINGPAIANKDNLYERRHGVIEYADKPMAEVDESDVPPDTSISYAVQHTAAETRITEDEIKKVLERTGKAEKENQLNCGACGYPSCYAQAVAVLQGMAEPETCLPYMRRLAEQRTDRIIDTSPNGIVILDKKLRILNMNPAFRKMFKCSEATCGKLVSVLMDPEFFEKLIDRDDTSPVTEFVDHKNYNLICHQIAYALPEENQYVGIFVDITNTQANQQKLSKLRQLTIMQAGELLEHQTKMAQQIAELLGQSAAKGEDLVEKLMALAREESTGLTKEDRNWLKDIYTST